MSRKHVLIAFGIVLLLAVPLTMAATDVTGVVGTTTDIDIGESDPDLAGLAGHAQYQVTWFDAAPIYERSIPTADGKEVCAVPDAQATPVGATLAPIATSYTTGAALPSAWTTTKYSYASGTLFTYCVPIGNVATDGTIGDYNFVMIVDTDDLGTTALDLYIV